MFTTIANTPPMISTDTILMMNRATIVSVATQAIATITFIHATATTTHITAITVITFTIVIIGTIAAGSTCGGEYATQ